MGKIQGIGVDVVDVQRMRDVLENQEIGRAHV
jgi:hypothetical protein